MSNALSVATNGILHAFGRATQSASNIANASLTQKDIAPDLINLKNASTDVAANAAVIQAEKKNEKALLDIFV